MIPNPVKTLAISAALAVFAGGAMAQATGTAAGTEVENTITLAYDGASNDGTPVRIELDPIAPAKFTVARKIDLSVTPETGGEELEVAPGLDAATMDFTLKNLGNPNEDDAEQDFRVDVAAVGSIADGSAALEYSDTVTTNPGTYYVLVDGGIYDTTNPSAIALASNEEVTIQIVANIPSTATDGLTDMFTVTAIAVDSSGNIEELDRKTDLEQVSTILADAESTTTLTGSDVTFATTAPTIDEEFNATAKALTRLKVTAPKLSASKSVIVLSEQLIGNTITCSDGVVSPTSNLAPIPGACVEYTITVTNADDATSTATNLVITDPLPDTLRFEAADNIQYSDGGSNTNAPAHDGSGTGGDITVTIDELPAGSTATLKIRATIE